MIGTIIYDVDGVLKNWVRGIANWLNDVHGHLPDLGVIERGDFGYDMAEVFPYSDPAEIKALIPHFHESEHYRHLPDLRGAREGVWALQAIFPMARHIACSAVGTKPAVIAERRRQCASFGIDELETVPYGESKREHFARLRAEDRACGTGTVVIEDSSKHAREAAEVGCIPILLAYKHNEGFGQRPGDPIYRVRDWREAVQVINDLTFLAKEAA